MSISSTAYLLAFLLAAAGPGDGGNRLAYLDEPASPYWPGLPAPRLVTPQWIGEEAVDVDGADGSFLYRASVEAGETTITVKATDGVNEVVAERAVLRE